MMINSHQSSVSNTTKMAVISPVPLLLNKTSQRDILQTLRDVYYLMGMTESTPETHYDSSIGHFMIASESNSSFGTILTSNCRPVGLPSTYRWPADDLPLACRCATEANNKRQGTHHLGGPSSQPHTSGL